MAKRPTKISDFEALLEIDQDDLDTAIVEQPTFYWWIGERLAELQSEVSALKGELELEEARADKEIRDNWDEEEDGKISNPVVAHAVARDEAVQEIKQELRDAQLQQAKFNRLEMAYSDRSRQLTNLVRLRTQEYFASPERSSPQARAVAQDGRREKIKRHYRSRQ